MTTISARPQALLTLAVLALLSEFIYVWDFLRTFPLLEYYRTDIDMGAITSHSWGGFVSFVAAFLALFVLLCLAWKAVQGLEDRLVLWLILGGGALFGLTMTFVYPVTAIDIFTYIDQSWIMVLYHQNPIFTVPLAHPDNPVMHLSGEWASFGAPYGPLGIIIDAIPTIFTRDDLLANLVGLKLMFSGIALADAYLAYLILRRISPRHALGGALLIAWNPLVIFETSANGHNDMAMLLFVLLGLYCLTDGGLLAGSLLVAASALVKYGTLILLPMVLVYGLCQQQDAKQRLRYLAATFAGFAALIAIAYVPFWQGPSTLSRTLFETNFYVASFSSVLGGLFPGAPSGLFVWLGRILFVPAYCLALLMARKSLPDLLRACFLAALSFLGLGVTNFKSWYATWPTVFAACSADPPTRAAAVLYGFCVTSSVALYGYVWVWLGISRSGTFTLVNTSAYLLDFSPVLIALMAGVIWHASAKRIERWLGTSSELPDAVPPG